MRSKNKEKLQKKLVKNIKNFLNKRKTKRYNMVVININISLKMKNKIK